MAQLVEQSLPTIEVHGLIPVIGDVLMNILFTYLLSTVLKRQEKKKRPKKNCLQKTSRTVLFCLFLSAAKGSTGQGIT